MLPDYLKISATDLGKGTPVKVRILGDMASIGRAVAEDMRDEILRNPAATLIVPVGPVDQYPLLAEMINRERINCRNVVFINMDEYLTDDDQFIPVDHPLSFRGFMNRLFYDRLDPALAPPPENRVFPDPQNPNAVPRLIEQRGGVDACFGGIGINGHIAFNEPPEPGQTMTVEEFAALPTRVLSLSRETRTINSVTVGGEITVIPRRAVTVGMKECLGARRVLHGPITAACPASLMRLCPDAMLTVADYVAEPPNILLR